MLGAKGTRQTPATRGIAFWQRLVLVGAIGALLPVLAPGRAHAAFGFDDVIARARKLAQEPFQAPPPAVPRWLLDITYDQWRDIRFRPEDALWRDSRSPFQVQFFHPGLYYDRVVAINVVNSSGVHPVPFSPSQFDYGKNNFASKVPQNLGYAGLRLHYPLKTPKYYDEVIVFLGASYFRAVGRNNGFGLSARGVAIDTALSSGEEFPFFKEFWLVRPAPGAKEMAIYALLDSPSLSGAYQFVVRPGAPTRVEVDERLFRRKDVEKLGIAPLTSMFFFGENGVRYFDNFRPEVHDSDGLQLDLASGEWLWRPLENPSSLQVSSFQTSNPRGFGLLQRDRNFEDYQDLESHYERRPSAWVVPEGDWGDGRVELVEIPTKDETNDNVVAYWVPASLPALGEPLSFAYKTYWDDGDADVMEPAAGVAVATRRDSPAKGVDRFVIDFSGQKLTRIPEDTVLRAVVTVIGSDSAAELLEQHVVKNTETGGWRLVFQVRPKTDNPVELRAFLEQGGNALTETWSYLLLP